MREIICIGHITHDHIVTPDIDLHIPGGTAWYFAWGMQSLASSDSNPCSPYRLITAVGEEDMPAVEQLREAGVRVEVLTSPATVYFENKYGANMNNRQQRVLSKAAPFTWDRLEPLLKGVDRPYFILGSLLADDFPLDVIKRLHEIGRVVVDVQGYLREVVGEEVRATDWPEKEEALQYVDVLKTNEYEMDVLTGENDPVKAVHKLGQWGVGEVLLTLGDLGSFIYRRKEDSTTRIEAFPPKKLVDTTGCGDTYTMAYVYRRTQGATVHDAGRFAAAVASLKLEHSGPFHGTVQQVNALIH
ncbi:MAG: ribokinase [Bacteroidales bacterium]|nr:ribokinase [Bacteroidales bacterium]